MQSYNWSRFLLRIPVKGDRQTLYRLWTTQQGLESWFLRKSAFTKPDGTAVPPESSVQSGDSYIWQWHGYDDNTAEKGTILQANGMDHFQFSFGKAGNVSVSFREEGGEMIVELLQDEIPTDERGKEYYHLGCSKGWVFYLANLKSSIEGGIDLRNKNLALKDVVSS